MCERERGNYKTIKAVRAKLLMAEVIGKSGEGARGGGVYSCIAAARRRERQNKKYGEGRVGFSIRRAMIRGNGVDRLEGVSGLCSSSLSFFLFFSHLCGSAVCSWDR